MAIFTQTKDADGHITWWGWVSLFGVIASALVGLIVYDHDTKQEAARLREDARRTSEMISSLRNLTMPVMQSELRAFFELPCRHLDGHNVCKIRDLRRYLLQKSQGRNLSLDMDLVSNPNLPKGFISQGFHAVAQSGDYARIASTAGTVSIVIRYKIYPFVGGKYSSLMDLRGMLLDVNVTPQEFTSHLTLIQIVAPNGADLEAKFRPSGGLITQAHSVLEKSIGTVVSPNFESWKDTADNFSDF